MPLKNEICFALIRNHYRLGGLTNEFEVQYLSPLVVRKELENMLYQKGDHYINEADLIGEHSITFWNLVRIEDFHWLFLFVLFLFAICFILHF